MGIARLLHARRRNTQAEETCIKTLQQVFQGVEIQHVVVQHLMQLVVLLGQGRAADGHYFLHIGRQQALAQHTLAHHAGGAE